jgi:RND family efflux transporter MFP subunit
MSAKNGSSSVVLKFGLVVAAIVAVAVVVFFRFRDIATVELVARGTATDAVPGSLVVYADGLTKELKAEVGGKVASCEALDRGRRFKKGDVLLQLDTTELEKQFAQTKDDYETAQQRNAIVLSNIDGWKAATQKLDEATRAKAPADEIAKLQAELDALVRANNPRRTTTEKNLENVRRRHDNGDASDLELKTAEDNLKAINIELDQGDFDAAHARLAHEKAMKDMQLQLEQRTIHAPTDGTVDDVRVWVGELIGGGSTVATFFSDARIVVAKIAEEDFSKIQLGYPAKVTLMIYPEEGFDAKVIKILPNAEPETQRYTVYLDVTVDPHRLLPNSNGQTVITVGVHPNVLLIPRRAVVDLNGHDGYVWIVKDGRIEKRTVTLGYTSLTTVEVEKGVAVGEQVIVENTGDFRDGQYVRAMLPK